MTCIAILKQDTKIVIGADSCVSYDDCKITSTTPKVWKVGGELFGGAGSVRFINIISAGFSWPERKNEITDYEYLVIDVVKRLRSLLKANANLGQEMPAESDEESELLFSYKSKIYGMGQDFSIYEPKQNYLAIGSGGSLAMGSLYTTENSDILDSPKDRLNTSLKAACEHNISVCAPFTIITKDI